MGEAGPVSLGKLALIVGDTVRRQMRIVLLSHPGVGMAELTGDHRHRHRPHGEDRSMGVTQHMESDGGGDAGALAGLAHRSQLFGALPGAAVIALEQDVID
jgi:hypothetical protein